MVLLLMLRCHSKFFFLSTCCEPLIRATNTNEERKKKGARNMKNGRKMNAPRSCESVAAQSPEGYLLLEHGGDIHPLRIPRVFGWRLQLSADSRLHPQAIFGFSNFYENPAEQDGRRSVVQDDAVLYYCICISFVLHTFLRGLPSLRSHGGLALPVMRGHVAAGVRCSVCADGVCVRIFL